MAILIACAKGHQPKHIVKLQKKRPAATYRNRLCEGIDFAEKMLEHAKTNLPDAHLLLEDITQVDLPSNHFDMILSFYTLFVLALEEQTIVFQKIYDALNRGGSTYFTLFSEEATQQKEFSGYLLFIGHTFYYAHTTPEKYRHMLESIGFTQIDMQTISIGPETCLWVYAEKV